MDETHSKSLAATVAIRKALEEVEWWQAVQEETKEQINFIIEHTPVLGQPFRDAYQALCKFTNRKRRLLKQNEKPNTPSVLFGLKMPEETYQSGREATKTLLGLGDWFEPNEADVQACRLICEHINILESLGVFNIDDPKSKDEP